MKKKIIFPDSLPTYWDFESTERTFGSTGPGRAKLERAGANLDHFGEEIRFENDSVLLAMVGIIATRAESAEAA